MATNERTFFGHPWGLANLFGVEMWERFSFYGLQAILLYYLYYQTTDGGLGIDESIATAIVGAYTVGLCTWQPSAAAGLPTACSVPNAPCFIQPSSSCSATSPWACSPASLD